jgi:CRP/FNR family transcriptional regulator, cyclic AMP receptor protein
MPLQTHRRWDLQFMAVTPELLNTFPVLKSLPENLLSELAQQSALRKFVRRSIVLKAGAREETLCFLFEGRLQGVDFTIDGREVGLYFVEPGDFCGELGLFDHGPQPEFVIALTNATVVTIPMESIRGIMRQNPGLANFLGSKLAARVRQMTLQRTLLGLPNVSQRVCTQLWLLVPNQAASAPVNSIIDNPPTHLEIAIMLNVSRETVTRVFQKLQNQQIVKRDGASRLLVTDVGALKEFAEGKKVL